MRNSILRLTVILAVAPVWAVAQEAVNPRDFTFKRLSTRDIVAGKRITVQIDPVEQAMLLAAAPKIDPYPDRSEPAAPKALPRLYVNISPPMVMWERNTQSATSA